MWTMIASWFGGPFVAFIKKVPAAVWWVLAGIIGVYALRADARADGERRGEAKAKEEFDKAIETANTQTEARADRAQQAGNEIDEQIYDDPDRSADSLNAVELRRLTGNDPHNHGRRVRDA